LISRSSLDLAHMLFTPYPTFAYRYTYSFKLMVFM